MSCIRPFPTHLSWKPTGFASKGSTTSVNVTPAGTVSIMRANRSAHVLRNTDGSVNLEVKRCQYIHYRTNSAVGGTHVDMVLLPSLLKIRKSDLVVTLWPTTSGFAVVPSRYSVTLMDRSRQLMGKRKSNPRRTRCCQTELLLSQKAHFQMCC